ncbi:MAG: hypothetical protein JOY62_00775 [Acidobacteriaceae bacterium]|nr:hypothetical protein [Acidobacteriaceae bacterium]MBV9778479.1 hypothetical protein [Acidobacteriaceae bacterium]
MDQNLLLVLTIFVIVSALALLIQAGTLIGLFVVARQLQAKVSELMPQIHSIVGTTKRTVENVEKHVDKIAGTTGSIMDITRQQLLKVDELVSDATTRAKVQMERAEMVLDDAMTRTQDTVSLVHRGVMAPVRQVHGIFSGLRTALSHLGRGGRPTVDHATSDEEMFI